MRAKINRVRIAAVACAFVMLGITLAVNLAVGFIAGIGLAYLLKSERLSV